jgi:ATP adenylyltransferase/5',5'''-P-1,P-4-tetraphosphate phosphorylase II
MKNNSNLDIAPTISFSDSVKNLFHEQLTNWELARTNFNGLKSVRTKTFSFDDFDVLVQFNSARIVSTGAKVDAKTISERKCFLCVDNRPKEQNGIQLGNYTLLVNPFPIFPEHFTIPYIKHIDQQIAKYFVDLVELAEVLENYVVFYNGPKCGASAPDHLHFQAGTKNFLPLINDYKRMKINHADLIQKGENFELFSLKNYLRTVFCIESTTVYAGEQAFESLYKKLQKDNKSEPMMNIACSFENGKWFTFILPRANFRPWQYTALEEDKQLMVSPATVEMCGIFITAVESHFERITKEDIISIFEQSSLYI